MGVGFQVNSAAFWAFSKAVYGISGKKLSTELKTGAPTSFG